MALAVVAQWVERQHANQKVSSSIPSQGTCLGCQPGPQLGMCKWQPIDITLIHQCLSPSLPLPLKTNKYDIKKKEHNNDTA